MAKKDAHFLKLERMYKLANSQKYYFETIDIDVQERKAIITLDIHKKYYHALNAVHGSVYFKLLDDASFFAVNSIVKDVFVLTTSFNINLIRPVTKGKLTAIGTTKFVSKNLFVGEAELFNEENKLIAFGIGNFSRSKIALSPEIGYTL